MAGGGGGRMFHDGQTFHTPPQMEKKLFSTLQNIFMAHPTARSYYSFEKHIWDRITQSFHVMPLVNLEIFCRPPPPPLMISNIFQSPLFHSSPSCNCWQLPNSVCVNHKSLNHELGTPINFNQYNSTCVIAMGGGEGGTPYLKVGRELSHDWPHFLTLYNSIWVPILCPSRFYWPPLCAEKNGLSSSPFNSRDTST